MLFFEPEQYNRIEFAKQNQLFILISIMSQFVTYPNNNLIFSFILYNHTLYLRGICKMMKQYKLTVLFHGTSRTIGLG